VSFDNFGSRFLGPYQATVTYQDSFLPLQETTLSALATTPSDELKYAAFRHKAAIYPDWTVELSGLRYRRTWCVTEAERYHKRIGQSWNWY